MASDLKTEELVALLHAGETCIVPTPMAARLWNERLLQQPSPLTARRALTWHTWVGTLWTELQLAGDEHRIVLNRTQELSLWKQAITRSRLPVLRKTLVPTASLASLAGSAYALAADYRVLGSLHQADTEDSRAFAQLVKDVADSVERMEALLGADLSAALTSHIEARRVPLPAHLHLVGFTEVLPSMQRLLDAVCAAGVAVTHHSVESSARTSVAIACASPAGEIQAAALLALQTLQARASARIGIVIPDPAAERVSLERTLMNTLAPAVADLTAARDTPWAFSAGSPALSLPVLRVAANVLHLATGALSAPEMTSLLLSGLIGDPEERDTAAVFDAQVLRESPLLRPEISLTVLAAMMRDAARHPQRPFKPLQWVNALEEAAKSLQPKRPRRYLEWADACRLLLRACGWPAQAAEPIHAQAEAFDSVLDALSTLDPVAPPVDFPGFLAALDEALAVLNLHDPELRPVTVLTINELAGCAFDHVILLHANDTELPAPRSTSPLLPRALQRSRDMPGTDPIATAVRTKSLLTSVVRASAQSTFLYAEADEDGALRPSPLLAELGLQAADPPSPPADQIPVTLMSAEESLSLPRPVSQTTHGGADVLKMQAECRFRAFARHRLNATTPQDVELGMDAGERGRLTHSALQHLWKSLRTQAKLLALTSAELDEVVRSAVASALQSTYRGNTVHDDWDHAYVGLQSERLANRIREWLQSERDRAPFEVLERESAAELSVGPLELRLRIDRTDATTHGLVLIDYKTGTAPSPTAWEGERPAEPQMPLYALTQQSARLAGLAYMKLQSGENNRFSGWTIAESLLPRCEQRDLLTETEHWREVLSRLAQAFVDGEIILDPRDGDRTCSGCEYGVLCRKTSSAPLLQGAEDDDD